MITQPLPNTVNLLFLSTELEGSVERAEGYNGSQYKDGGEHDQDNAERAGNYSAKIQVGEQGGDDDTDDTVEVGHIAFHREISFGGKRFGLN